MNYLWNSATIYVRVSDKIWSHRRHCKSPRVADLRSAKGLCSLSKHSGIHWFNLLYYF
ncbi:hypothetical protein DICVIV_13566 [Dictyocaulus viviparus]|uniref:Uncharacterized protein n=1 Tax=Dictyocaulus viviparus TaxID=29172 RepID=A0A0D8XDG6_DICVI|nr:hypothetical protein DICVIV_13566 [Dictyocaulus viviparus]